MKTFIKLSTLLFFMLILSHCVAPRNPLEGIDIPEPANPDPSYYFFRGAKTVLRKQTQELAQARTDLEQVIAVDNQILYPEAYPFLVEVYNQLGLSDTASWIYTEAKRKLEAAVNIPDSVYTRFAEWQSVFPEYPQEFKERGYKLLDSSPEPQGGYQALYRSLEYPEMARSMNRTGMSYFSILIDADGTLLDVQLLLTSYPDLDEAALAAIHKATWKAAKYRGRPVPFQLVLPIVFRL